MNKIISINYNQRIIIQNLISQHGILQCQVKKNINLKELIV